MTITQLQEHQLFQIEEAESHTQLLALSLAASQIFNAWSEIRSQLPMECSRVFTI